MSRSELPNAYCGYGRQPAALVAVLVAAGTLFFASGPARAAKQWSAPQQLSLSPGAILTTRVVSDARGDALVVWSQVVGGQCCTLFYRWRPPRGAWTPAQVLAQSTEGRFGLGITPFGGATAVWADAQGDIVSGSALPGRGFTDQVLDRPSNGIGWSFPELAVDDQGDAVAVWAEAYQPGLLRFAFRHAGSSFGPPQSPAPSSSGIYSVAMNAAGAAAIAWSTQDGMRLSYRPPAGSFGPPEQVPENGTVPVMTVAPDGEVVVAGTNLDPHANTSDATGFADRLAGGEWQQRTVLAGGGIIDQTLAEPDGAVSFVTEAPDGTNGRTVLFSSREPDGRPIGPQAVSPPDSGWPSVAMDSRGDMLATWSDNADGEARGTRIAVADRPAEGAFGPQTVLTNQDSISSQAAIIDGGAAIVTWSQPTQPADPQNPNSGLGTAVLEAVTREDPSAPPLPFPPQVQIGPAREQRVHGRDVVRLSLRSSQPCAIHLTVLLHVGNQAVEVRGPKARLARHHKRLVSLRLSHAAARLIRRARAGDKRAWASVMITAAGRSPRPVTFSRALRLPQPRGS